MQKLSIEQLVEAARKQRASVGKPMQPGATSAEIQSLVEEARETFGAELPPGYLDLLRLMNGMNENSLHVFATHIVRDASSDACGSESFITGFTPMNLELRGDEEELNSMLIFACDDTYHYALHIDSGDYLVRPLVISPPSRIYKTFEELMASAFKLNIGPPFFES